MDRSFLAFRQFLHRIISGNNDPKPATEPVRRTPRERRVGARDDDWTRVEF
jgi:hypothetical protein